MFKLELIIRIQHKPDGQLFPKFLTSTFFLQQQVRRATFQKALKVFSKIALNDKRIINLQAVEDFFSSYSQSCYDILMRQMDFNKDGVITQNEWIAYWEYIRMAGYDFSKINKELNRIQKGEVSLDFPKAKTFHANQPRLTLLNNILANMKSDQSTIPFLENLPEQNT